MERRKVDDLSPADARRPPRRKPRNSAAAGHREEVCEGDVRQSERGLAAADEDRKRGQPDALTRSRTHALRSGHSRSFAMSARSFSSAASFIFASSITSKGAGPAARRKAANSHGFT